MHQGIGPKDTIESLLAAQMVATHNMAMEFSKRTMLSGQHPDVVDANINRVTKLMSPCSMRKVDSVTGLIFTIENVNIKRSKRRRIRGMVSLET